MPKHFKSFLIFLFLAVATMAFSAHIHVEPGTPQPDELEISVPYFMGTFQIQADIDAVWKVTEIPDWVVMDPMFGDTHEVIDITLGCQTNVETERTGEVILSEKSLDLFISEYCEGTGDNKYIEIFNGTGEDVTLDGTYQLVRLNDGGAWATDAAGVDLTGTIVDGDVFVVYPDVAGISASITAAGDQAWAGISYDGNDAIGLVKITPDGNFLIDVIGAEGNAPAVGWDVAGTVEATANHTIIRKPDVFLQAGDWATSAGTNQADSQWIVMANDDYTDIGVHNQNEGVEAVIEITQMAPIDLAIVLDRTASMAQPGQENNAQFKFRKARVAAALMVGLTAPGDEPAHTGAGAEIGWVTFHGSADDPILPLSQLGSMDDVNTVMQAMVNQNIPTATPYLPEAWTSIGAGLIAGADLLTDATFANYHQCMLLLSDGVERREPWIATAIGSVPFNVDVHTIAFGIDDWTGQEDMEYIAQQTEGTFFWLDHTANDPMALLTQQVTTIMTELTGYEILTMLEDYYDPAAPQRSIKEYEVNVDSAMDFVNFNVAWYLGQSDFNVSLISPSGEVIDADDTVVGVQFRGFDSNKYFRVYNPEQGTWRVLVENTALEDGRETYIVTATGLTNLKLDMSFANQTFNEVIKPVVNVNLTEDEAPITDATILASLFEDDGFNAVETITLFDDGAHDDGLAGDGIYGGEFTTVNTQRAYNVRIKATGTTVNGDSFERLGLRSFVSKTYTDADDDTNAPEAANNAVLAQNSPNPFNPTTNIKFAIPADGKVTLDVYNIKGQKVTTLVNGFTKKGNYNIPFNGVDANGNSIASGVYMYKLNYNGKSQIKKMLLLK